MSPGLIHEEVAGIIEQQRARPGALLPILHAIQDAVGYVPADSVVQIALALNLSRAEVHGVITFYHHFRTTPPAKQMIQVCRAEACQSRGGEHLADHVARKVIGYPAGDYEVQPVYCLGLCANAPALMIGETLHARVTPEKFDRLIDTMRGNS
ncbi:MAG TPA: NAD(P)H-dependent oxidoreductase subunit E [Halothiobacillus sp.]|nr:NAD(P)H-dependent oxidoreductase subunit E [Halothiobacillus sp.]